MLMNATMDIIGPFMQADVGEDKVHMRSEGSIAGMLINLNKNKFKIQAVSEKGKTAI